MSAEFILSFKDTIWYTTNLKEIVRKITSLRTFSKSLQEKEFRLMGTEPRSPGDWNYDVRLFLEKERIFLEISAHPSSIENDLSAFFEWIRSHTEIAIDDEDGVPSNW
ncbi:3-hydroxydecyl-ACP dehydratase [Pseudomonas helvetica]|uniref:3-hydroxydecyl-ACP dehydratase n=1 Tax=Pseudomonas helvetica TaxID=3136738 RepID=UPI0032677D65